MGARDGDTESIVVQDKSNPGLNRLGEQQIVDLVGVMGYYQTVSMLLNVDRYALAGGTQPELKPLP